MKDEQETLFGVPPEHPKLERKKKIVPKYRGLYAAEPGTGPKDETCRSCKHKTCNKWATAKKYIKCALTEKHWTGGSGTDILAGAPACFHWEKK